jgi:hypothetical protein
MERLFGLVYHTGSEHGCKVEGREGRKREEKTWGKGILQIVSW